MSELDQNQNSTRYVKLNMGAEALIYLKTEMGNGKSYSTKCLRTIDLDQGTISTFLPSDLKLVDSPINFQYGRLIRSSPSTELLINHIVDYLSENKDGVFIVEDSLAKPSDPCIQKLSENVFFINEEVFHYTSSENNTRDICKHVLDESFSFLQIGFLSKIPSGHQFPRTQFSITDAILQSLVANTDKIFVRAFDGESYLLWEGSFQE